MAVDLDLRLARSDFWCAAVDIRGSAEPVKGVCLSVCNQRAYTDNSTDAVKSLFINLKVGSTWSSFADLQGRITFLILLIR